jgi:hypothetical protein
MKIIEINNVKVEKAEKFGIKVYTAFILMNILKNYLKVIKENIGGQMVLKIYYVKSVQKVFIKVEFLINKL